MVIDPFTMDRRCGSWIGTKVPSRSLPAGLEPGRLAVRYAAARKTERNHMLGTILIVILILVLVGALPTWGHSRNWGYAPSGGLGLVLLIVLILVLTGNL